MTGLLLGAALLGVAGFDPVGALVLAAAAARGASRGVLAGVALVLAPATLGDPAYLAVIVLGGRAAAAHGPGAAVATHRRQPGARPGVRPRPASALRGSGPP